MAIVATNKTESVARRGWSHLTRRYLTGHVAVFALFLVLAAIWLRPLPWQMTDHVTGPGDPLITAWRVVWPAQWLTVHPAGFWDTNVLYPGRSVFARDELTFGESLIATPVYVTTHSALLAYNLTLLMTLALSGFCTYYCVEYFLRSLMAGIIAGLIVALAPYHIAQLDHMGLLAVQWLPLVLVALDRTLRTRAWRDAALLGIAALLQVLAAGYYAYWTALVIALYLGYVALRRRSLLSLVGITRVGIALAVALLALLPIVLQFRQVSNAEGFARPLGEVEYWSARPQTWLAATPQNLLYGSLVRAHAWTWSTEMYLFPGVVAILLAILPFLMRGHRRLRWFALALVVSGFVLTLGPTLHLARRDAGHLPLPYALLYRFVPGGDALRAPVRAAPIAFLGLALLAGMGWQRIAASLRKRGTSRAFSVIVACVICGGLCAEYAIAPLRTVAIPQLETSDGTIAHWLQQQPPSIVAVLPGLRPPVTMAIATTNRHRFINGDAEILPRASAALFDALAPFPDERSISALAAVGVDLVVLDRRAYPEQAWGAMQTRLVAFPDDLALAATLSDGLIYRVVPAANRFAALRHILPPDATVLIAHADPTDRTYLDRALVSHVLRDRRVYGALTTGWISDPAPPKPELRYDYGVFGSGEIVPATFDQTMPVWTDGMLVVYAARGTT